ncbi:hypothetical protein HNQ04_002721 [Deinococcus radiopugnans ATCC 19172]|uniref:Uncharacterized protein n=1 Tax=Deinococcus radiopugnans ATCC 19172 TaxID=585398 RepID=A0ABR6NX22_9DEIO|nr:hypothetical protein [Deinococcus radiopugnans ATCC 19172]
MGHAPTTGRVRRPPIPSRAIWRGPWATGRQHCVGSSGHHLPTSVAGARGAARCRTAHAFRARPAGRGVPGVQSWWSNGPPVRDVSCGHSHDLEPDAVQAAGTQVSKTLNDVRLLDQLSSPTTCAICPRNARLSHIFPHGFPSPLAASAAAFARATPTVRPTARHIAGDLPPASCNAGPASPADRAGSAYRWLQLADGRRNSRRAKL